MFTDAIIGEKVVLEDRRHRDLQEQGRAQAAETVPAAGSHGQRVAGAQDVLLFPDAHAHRAFEHEKVSCFWRCM